MSRKYPTRDVMEWDFQKGNLNEPTKKYSLQAARITRELGGLIHFFCVGRVLEVRNCGGDASNQSGRQQKRLLSQGSAAEALADPSTRPEAETLAEP